MIETNDIIALAKLAELTPTNEELAQLSHDMEAIIGYISAITEVSMKETDDTDSRMALHNVLREDVPTTIPGAYTEALLALAPKRQNNFVSVKKILP